MAAIPAYDAIADWYDQYIQGDPFYYDRVCAVVGDVAGQEICDLACGQGALARALARRDARVTGVDISMRLLEIATRYEANEPLDITYRCDDAQVLATVADATFDGVVCSLALMDIPDIEATYRAVARVVRPRGWFVFAIVHPCFYPPGSDWVRHDDGTTSRQVRDYFAEVFWHSDNPHGVRGKVGAHHRTLSTYMNLLVAAGWRIERLHEPQAMGEIARQVPGYAEIPLMLIVRCTKADN